MESTDITIRRVGDLETEKNTLPRGVKALILDNRLIFVRRVGGRFIPLLETEQAKLRKKHVI